MHGLCLGVTRTGKTSLMLLLIPKYKSMGFKVAVLTVPMMDGNPDPRWRKAGADFVTTDKKKFLAVLHAPGTWRVMCFIDECNQTVGWHDLEMESLATAGSQHGLICHFISQRGQTFNKSVREQCTRLFLFRQGPDDAKALFNSFPHRAILDAVLLRNGEFFACTNEPGSLKVGKLPLYEKLYGKQVSPIQQKYGSTKNVPGQRLRLEDSGYPSKIGAQSRAIRGNDRLRAGNGEPLGKRAVGAQRLAPGRDLAYGDGET